MDLELKDNKLVTDTVLTAVRERAPHLFLSELVWGCIWTSAASHAFFNQTANVQIKKKKLLNFN